MPEDTIIPLGAQEAEWGGGQEDSDLARLCPLTMQQYDLELLVLDGALRHTFIAI